MMLSFTAEDFCLGDLSLAQRAFGHLLVPTLIYTAWGFVGCSGHFA